METPWHVRRSTVAQHDGERRWDEAYQFLLQWTMEHEAGKRPAPSHPQEDTMEVALYAQVSSAVNNSTKPLNNNLAVYVTLSPHNPSGMSPTSTSTATTDTAAPLSSVPVLTV